MGLAFVITVSGLFMVASVPTLGLTLVAGANGDSVRVEAVASGSPNRTRLQPGTVLVAAQVAGQRLPLSASTLAEEPDLLSYRQYNQFIESQSLLYQSLRQGQLTVINDKGEHIVLEAGSSSGSPALLYALLHAPYGWVALLVSLGIWAFRPERVETRLFALSGVGMFGTTLTLALYGGRELALDGTLIAGLIALNHLAVLMVCAPLATLFWVYPIRQGRAPVPIMGLCLALLAWLADLLQWAPGARYTLYLPIVVGFAVGIGIMIRQWRITASDPVARAALKWCVLSIFVGSLLLMMLIMIPPALGLNRPLPLALSLLSVLVLYLGLAAGLQRYRLFDLERWWFRTWAWFLGGALVLALDAVLVLGIGLGGEHALLLSLAIAGWGYFPLRQSLMRYFSRDQDQALDAALQKLVDNLFSAHSESRIRAAWPDLLRRSFNPLELAPFPRMPTEQDVMVSTNGVHCYIQTLVPGEPHYRVSYPGAGGRLFSRADLRIAALLRQLTRQAVAAARAREAGAEVERHRIIRDLHDDLGGHILSLLRNAPDDRQAGRARQAMRSLREALRALDEEAVCFLADSVDEWQLECRDKCQRESVSLEWRQRLDSRDRSLTVRHDINVRRILGEALSNAFQHARPHTVTVSVWARGKTLAIDVSNDGVPAVPGPADDEMLGGRGLTHMRIRAWELGGAFRFEVTEQHARAHFTCVLE